MERNEAIALYKFVLDPNHDKADILNLIEDEVGGLDILSFEDWLVNVASDDIKGCPEGQEQLDKYEEYLDRVI